MGIAERKEREKEEMQKLILETANQLFLDQGFEKTSMRNIADAIEYSPGTIYLYFKDKNELFHAIHKKGFDLFYQYVSRVMVISDPMERLDQLGSNYLQFAIDHPGYYDLMLIMRSPMKSEANEDRWEQGSTSHQILTTTVADCIRAGHFKGKDPEVVSFMIWAEVHGLSAMLIRDRLKFVEEKDRDRILFGAKELFTEMIRKF